MTGPDHEPFFEGLGDALAALEAGADEFLVINALAPRFGRPQARRRVIQAQAVLCARREEFAPRAPERLEERLWRQVKESHRLVARLRAAGCRLRHVGDAVHLFWPEMGWSASVRSRDAVRLVMAIEAGARLDVARLASVGVIRLALESLETKALFSEAA